MIIFYLTRFMILGFITLNILSCRASATLKEQPGEVADHPTVTPPPGRELTDVVHESLDSMGRIVGQYQSGIGAALRGSIANSYAGWNDTYYVPQGGGFVGEFVLFHGRPEARDVVIICQLDHRQVPCHPTDPVPHIASVIGGEPHFLPLQVTDLERGLHDFDVLAVLDPYVNMVDEDGDDLRTKMTAIAVHKNILVEGAINQPDIDLVTVPTVERRPFESIMHASLDEKLTNELGNIPFWIEAEGTAGENLPFFLHFLIDERTEDIDGDVIAVSAFVNYEQIPIFIDDSPYQPLFVEREANSWQTLPVEIQLPSEAGEYELLIFARSDAFERFDYKPEEDRVPAGSETSNRIRLIVKPE